MKSIFSIRQKDGSCAARTGVLHLPHGDVETPVFMPVGTCAAVKAVPFERLEEIGFQIILSNAYHLFLRPGADLVEKAGGLHGFSKWSRNFLTDSGGFQVFSLSRLRKLTGEGVEFQSHIDGSRHFLTPEKMVQTQVKLNSDIQMQLDVCTGYGATRAQAQKALKITSDWARRAKAEWLLAREKGYEGSLFSIVQGNFFADLRKESAQFNAELDLPGIAIGGLSVGEPKEVYDDFLAQTAAEIPEEKPKYVMGIGSPDYIFSAVEHGIDMFDCVLPTRNARNGSLFTSQGAISIKKAEFSEDFLPIDPECRCPVCQKYSRAYLRHLFKSGEILFSTLASLHNLWFLREMMQKMRQSIEKGEFLKFKREFLGKYENSR